MGLSRLENFIRSIRGNIIYVDPNALDSTDSIENTGTSLARPFKTLQRALIEASRFSYLPGQDNDKFGNTSILLYPGDHLVDNRPGLIPTGSNFRFRNGSPTSDFTQFSAQSNFDLTTDNNELYKLNSVHGGVIVPRGTSIVGMDLRKTKIRPKYVPDPTDDTVERSAIFKVTGACYLWQFTIFDADPNGQCFYNYNNVKAVPNFSHHKLTAFEYADGVNNVDLDIGSFDRTDLEMYYEKISIAYGDSSGRKIDPTYPNVIDIQPKIDEYRIVGSKGEQVGITSITASGTKITVTLDDDVPYLQVDTPIRIDGVLTTGYNGQFVVNAVVDTNKIQYNVSTAPTITDGGSGGTLSVVVDTVTSASPYIFNISLRSVYGMCGLHADGNKADGFKSIVVAQFTGISLQKDSNAFILYNPTTGLYEDRTTSSTSNLYSNSKSRYKLGYLNYHVKASNDAIIQAVSIFAIGYAEHFVAEAGGDQSITNSNSNFGANSLSSRGFKTSSFARDDVGYITHIIPPQKIGSQETVISPFIEFNSIDRTKTLAVGSSNRLYLYNQINELSRPQVVVDGYRIGAKPDDTLNVLLSGQEYGAIIAMQGSTQTSYKKSSKVKKKIDGIRNEINSNIITLTEAHDFVNGESIKIVSSDGSLPSGIEPNKIYYVITSSTLPTLTSSQIKLAKTFNDALNGANITSAIDLYSIETGNLKIVSKVSDKVAGDPGHPIQWDSTNNQWYLSVKSSNPIWTALATYPFEATPRTYIKRTIDTRSLDDKIFKFRYVIPKDSLVKGRPPLDGYIIQESSSNIGSDFELSSQFDFDVNTITRTDNFKNIRVIADAKYSGGVVTITSEVSHNLSIGSKVDIRQISSSDNTTAQYNAGYNGIYTVTDILSSTEFKYSTNKSPGTFLNNTSLRTVNLPYFTRKNYKQTYIVYRSQEVQPYIRDVQDGIYHIITINTSNSPRPAEFSQLKFSQPIQYLYPQENRDNPISDPQSTVSYALPDPIGQVIIDDPQSSLTKETVDKFQNDFRSKFGILNIRSSTGTSHTIYTDIDHGLNGITKLSVVSGSAGLAYGSIAGVSGDLYNARLVGFAGSTVGEGATAVIRIDASGSITSVNVINPGSAYGVGNTLSVVGVATTAGHVVGVVQVDAINNSINDTIYIDEIKADDILEYNNIYRVSGITTSRSINVISSSNISKIVTNGISTLTSVSNVTSQLGPKSLLVSSILHPSNSTTGIVTTTTAHGLKINSKIKLYDSTSSRYNQDFIITKINSLTSFEVNIGFTTTTNTTLTSIYSYPYSYSSNSGSISLENEKTTSRIVPIYGGITNTLSANALTSDNAITISNAVNSGLKIGDFVSIDNEIVKISANINSNIVPVFRGVLGSIIEPHTSGSVVRKITPIPTEFRRHSILRASGHTFEYVGFGPGNYSTALPDSQDRLITPQEELLAQSFKSDGGINVFTGMNNDGDFYIGNKKVSSATGQEEIYDAPIPTVTGEDKNERTDIISTSEVNILKSIKVEGGISKDIISKFDGPVVFNDKITSTSDKGIEANSVFLQGSVNVSRKISVGIATPILIANSGDIDFNGNPNNGGSAGWIFTEQNQWREFAPVKDGNGRYCGIWSGTFYGDGSSLSGLEPSWVVQPSVGIYTGVNVGIGTIATTKAKLSINGILNVSEIIEKATIVTTSWPTLLPSTTPVDIYIGDNNVYYYTSAPVANWTINFTGGPGVNLGDILDVGQSITVAFLATIGTAPLYNSNIIIDGNTVTPLTNVYYYGGTQFTTGYLNGIDVYTYVIIRKSASGTLNDQFTILASQSTYGR
jgi:hypothetical protein